MCLGRTGCAAAAVTAGAAAEQNNNITVLRYLATYIFRRRRSDHRADFHALCHVTIVVQFIHLAGGKSDLVAIRAVARRSRCDQLALRKFAGQRLADRLQRIACARHAHGSIHIGTAGERIADCAADTGCGAAKRFDFCRMIVGLVFKE